MNVHKFGETSLKDSERISSVGDIISDHWRKNMNAAHSENLPELIVVVSAMSCVYDDLIKGALAAVNGDDLRYTEIKDGLLTKHHQTAQELLRNKDERFKLNGIIEDYLHHLVQLYRSIALIGELTVRVRDRIASIGELLSANLLAAVLRERGLLSQAVNASEFIICDQKYGAAYPLIETTKERAIGILRPQLANGIIPVITGYIAATEEGVLTTLGRGGSDFTAAILGTCLQANEVWIWSDVNGILTADPSIVPHASTISELSYTEAAELAQYGADVLHPNTIKALVGHDIPLRLLNSFHPENPGTLIVSDPNPTRRRSPAIISTTGLSLIRLSRNGNTGPWSLEQTGQVLITLNEAGLEIPMLSQSFSEENLNLVIRQSERELCLAILENQLGDESIFSVEECVSTISVVGVPGWNGQNMLAHTFTALGKGDVPVIAIAQAASECSVSICIPERDTTNTVRTLHQELGLDVI